jgi:hypothetical protein
MFSLKTVVFNLRDSFSFNSIMYGLAWNFELNYYKTRDKVMHKVIHKVVHKVIYKVVI